jgi:hypothetical protein
VAVAGIGGGHFLSTGITSIPSAASPSISFGILAAPIFRSLWKPGNHKR